jgi:hypothetical protein
MFQSQAAFSLLDELAARAHMIPELCAGQKHYYTMHRLVAMVAQTQYQQHRAQLQRRTIATGAAGGAVDEECAEPNSFARPGTSASTVPSAGVVQRYHNNNPTIDAHVVVAAVPPARLDQALVSIQRAASQLSTSRGDDFELGEVAEIEAELHEVSR